jgi:uracil-DNA glycosylase
MPGRKTESFAAIQRRIVHCEHCPRLRTYCARVAREKKAAHREEDYWGRPVPSFGDPQAALVVVGLAPAAHGANRTGRMFTGDRSGDWLYRALHKAGFANQASSRSRNDGLELHRACILAAAHCAPPDNKPGPGELKACAEYLEAELRALREARVYLALGQIALAALWPLLAPENKRPQFGHGREIPLPEGRALLLSYHPSQQNTFTGRLTEPMFDSVFRRASELVAQK